MNTQTYTTVKPYKRRKRGTSAPDPTVTTQVIEKPCVHENLEELNHRLVLGGFLLTGQIAFLGVVATHLPVIFWASLTAILTWKGLNLWHKHHKPATVEYMLLEGEEQKRQLEAQGEKVLTVPADEYTKVYRDGVLTHIIKNNVKGVKV